MLREAVPVLLKQSSLSSPHQSIVSRLASLVALDQTHSPSSLLAAPHCHDDWSATAKARRAALRRHSKLHDAAADHRGRSPGAFVASAVCGSTVEAERCSAAGVSHHLDVSVGVNFELHRATLQNSSSCGCVEGGLPLQGLLKGCAEQNAIGSFGAGGRSYHLMRHVFLCSHALAAAHHCSTHECMAHPDGGGIGCDAEAVIRTPCAECWRHLCTIATMVHRCSRGSEALHLHVVAVDPGNTPVAPRPGGLDAEGQARKRHKRFVWDPSLRNASRERGELSPLMSFVLADAGIEAPPGN
jgi:hypothetical protein